MEGFILYFRTDYRSCESITQIYYFKDKSEDEVEPSAKALAQNKALQLFYSMKDHCHWEGGFKKAMQNLTESLKVDRVFVYKNYSCKTDVRITIKISSCGPSGSSCFELEQEEPI